MTTKIEIPVEDLKARARGACKSVVEYSDRALGKGQDFVRANPLPLSLFSAFAIGFAISALLPRPARSRRERYLDSRLNELKELLQSTSRRLGDATQETRDNTSSAISGAIAKLKSSF